MEQSDTGRLETLSFVEQDNSWFIKRHIGIVKAIGTVLIVCVMCGIIPPMVLIATTNSSRPVDAVIESGSDMNHTACIYVKQFVIGGNVRVTVCNRGSNTIVVDVRRFINGTSTILGIPIDVQQWRRLKQTVPLIDKAIDDAKTYWSNLQTY